MREGEVPLAPEAPHVARSQIDEAVGIPFHRRLAEDLIRLEKGRLARGDLLLLVRRGGRRLDEERPVGVERLDVAAANRPFEARDVVRREGEEIPRERVVRRAGEALDLPVGRGEITRGVFLAGQRDTDDELLQHLAGLGLLQHPRTRLGVDLDARRRRRVEDRQDRLLRRHRRDEKA